MNMDESAHVVQFQVFGWPCAGHARNCCVDHEYSTTYPFIYSHKECPLVPFPSDVWHKVFSWDPAGCHVCPSSWFGVLTKVVLVSKTTCDPKHDVDFLVDLVLIDHLFFSNTRRI
jgi:hypothetical protein